MMCVCVCVCVCVCSLMSPHLTDIAIAILLPMACPSQNCPSLADIFYVLYNSRRLQNVGGSPSYKDSQRFQCFRYNECLAQLLKAALINCGLYGKKEQLFIQYFVSPMFVCMCDEHSLCHPRCMSACVKLLSIFFLFL